MQNTALHSLIAYILESNISNKMVVMHVYNSAYLLIMYKKRFVCISLSVKKEIFNYGCNVNTFCMLTH